MRLSNRQKVPWFNFQNTVVIALIALGFLLFVLEKFKFNILGIEENLLILFPIILAVISYLRGRQIFEYDSDGEMITIKNRRTNMFFPKVSNDEFPKYKVVDYQVVNFIIYKKLYLYINSKKHQKITLKYDISYLTKKEINNLKYSLSKIVKENKNNPISNENSI